MYHPLEVAEAGPTESEDAEEVEEEDVGNHVEIKIAIVQRMDQYHQRPEEPRRRYKQRPLNDCDPDSDVADHVVIVYLLHILCLRRLCLRHLQRVVHMLVTVDKL